MIDYTAVNATTGDLSALCGVCETVMHRRTRFDSIAVKMPKLSVQIREAVSRLSECASPSLNHDNEKDS